MKGGHLIKSWSKTMATISLSTGEAELGATIRGAAEVEGVRSILRDFGLEASISLESDASAAVGITGRLGLGRVRHLAVSDLWIQQKVRNHELSISKIDGIKNPADLLTKALARGRIEYLYGLLGMGQPSPPQVSTHQSS